MIALSESVMKFRRKRPLAEKSRWLHYPACNETSLSRKPCITDKTLLWNTIRKSWSLFQIPSWKFAGSAPLAYKSRWRHIQLAMKPRYLGNHASQIKSYYGTPSGSHGRSFRIRHKNSPEALPSGEVTMTSYPACNKSRFLGNHASQIKVCIERHQEVMVALS